MYKNIKIFLVGLAAAGLMTSMMPMAYAQGTVLPLADKKANCNKLINDFNNFLVMPTGSTERANTLGCAINTGRVSLPMVPYFIQYFSNYLLGMVSLIALLFVVIGGFMYSAGGMIEQKDKGKVYIKNALIGMTIAFLAWSIVSVILAAITG